MQVQNPGRKWVETWRYEWHYTIKGGMFRIVKRPFMWNGKKIKPIKGAKNILVLEMPPPFKPTIEHGTKEVTKYDHKAWCVSERDWTETVQTISYDRKPFQELFEKTIKSLPPQPVLNATT